MDEQESWCVSRRLLALFLACLPHKRVIAVAFALAVLHSHAPYSLLCCVCSVALWLCCICMPRIHCCVACVAIALAVLLLHAPYLLLCCICSVAVLHLHAPNSLLCRVCSGCVAFACPVFLYSLLCSVATPFLVEHCSVTTPFFGKLSHDPSLLCSVTTPLAPSRPFATLLSCDPFFGGALLSHNPSLLCSVATPCLVERCSQQRLTDTQQSTPLITLSLISEVGQNRIYAP